MSTHSRKELLAASLSGDTAALTWREVAGAEGREGRGDRAQGWMSLVHCLLVAKAHGTAQRIARHSGGAPAWPLSRCV